MPKAPYGTFDLGRNTAVVDIPGPNGQATAKAQATVNIDVDTGLATQGSSGRAVKAYRQTCTTSATPLAGASLANGVVVKALSANGGIAFLGPAGVTSATGFPLSAGEAVAYGVANANQIYLVCSDAVSVVAVTGN